MTTRYQTPDLRDADGNRILPRTLLQEAVVTTATGDVVLDLPTAPWRQFEVQIEDWAPTNNQVAPIFQLGINGGIRAGASDYQLNVSVYTSNLGVTGDFDDANENVRMTRDDNTVQAGNQADESFDYSVIISPGEDAAYLPRVRFYGVGINDSGRAMGIQGFGVYRGVTSIEYGRADQIRFAFDDNTIARGRFRLYGTE